MDSIRLATPDDAAGIAHVHVTGWQTTYRGMIPDAYLDRLSAADRARHWDRLLRDPDAEEFVFVAEDQGQIVGFASGGPNRTVDLPEFTGELYSIYLLPDRRRHGLGQQLTRLIIACLLERDYTSMLVWVLRDNPARRFYEALGGRFIREGTFEILGESIAEVGYGWDDLRAIQR